MLGRVEFFLWMPLDWVFWPASALPGHTSPLSSTPVAGLHVPETSGAKLQEQFNNVVSQMKSSALGFYTLK